jgi:hypothetical protein
MKVQKYGVPGPADVCWGKQFSIRGPFFRAKGYFSVPDCVLLGEKTND